MESWQQLRLCLVIMCDMLSNVVVGVFRGGGGGTDKNLFIPERHWQQAKRKKKVFYGSLMWVENHQVTGVTDWNFGARLLVEG